MSFCPQCEERGDPIQEPGDRHRFECTGCGYVWDEYRGTVRRIHG